LPTEAIDTQKSIASLFATQIVRARSRPRWPAPAPLGKKKEREIRQARVPPSRHYYTNFTGGGRFRFSAAGKAVRRGLETMVNRGLTAAGGLARRG